MIAAIDGATLVFDTGPLSCFARAGRLDMLREIVSEAHCVATTVVIREIANGVAFHPSLQVVLDAEWLHGMALETRGEIDLLADYSRTLDRGEAATLAWAEVHDSIAIVDERTGVNIAKQRGVAIHGTLWLIAQALNAGIANERQAIDTVDKMLAAGARFPFDRGAGFIAWARRESLIG